MRTMTNITQIMRIRTIEVVNSTVLQGSPGTITTDGITALPNILTENPRPDPDPKFKSTPKKSVNDSVLKVTNTSTKVTPDAPEIVTNTLVDEHRNITVPTIIVDDAEDAGNDNNQSLKYPQSPTMI